MELRTSHSFLIIFPLQQFLFVCLFLLYVCVCARMCTPKVSLLCHSSGTFSFLDRVSYWDLNLPTEESWLVTEPQGFPCPRLCSSGTIADITIAGSFMQALSSKVGYSFLGSKHFTDESSAVCIALSSCLHPADTGVSRPVSMPFSLPVTDSRDKWWPKQQ